MVQADLSDAGESVDILDTREAGPAAIRGGAVRAGGYLVGVAVSVLSAAVLFRHLGVDDGGRYVTITSLVALVAGLTDAGLLAIGVRELTVRSGEARERLVPNLLGLRIVLTLAGILIATGFSAVAGYGAPLVLGTALGGVGLLLQIVQSTLTVALLSRLRLGIVAALDLVRQLATVALIVALVAAGARLVPLLAVPIPVGLLVLASTILIVRGDIRVLPHFHPVEWRVLLREVLPYAVATVVAAIYFRLTIILMSLIATPDETGYFGVSFRVIDVLIVLPQLVVGAAYPIFARAARDDRSRLRYATQRMFEATMLLGGGLAVLLGTGAPLAILIVAGPKFDPAGDVLRVQGAALAASFVTAGLSYVLLSLRMHREMLLTALVGLIATVAGTLALVPPWGALGGAAATALTETSIAIAVYAVLARTHRDLVPSARALPRILVAAGVAVLPAIVFQGAPIVVVAAAGVAIYALLALALRAVPDEILDEVRRVRLRLAR